MIAVLVGLAAALGALLRWSADTAVSRRLRSPLPAGTIVVNLTGSFALGLLTGLATRHGIGTDTTDVVGTGLLGGYTTWSTYVWESVALARDGSPTLAAVNVAGSLGAGLGAAALGLLAAHG